MTTPLIPAIFGLETTKLTEQEVNLFTAYPPVGYILFARNCETPIQLIALTDALKSLHNDYTPLILIDQEGGRVARLKEPHWVTPPPPQTYCDMARESPESACDAAYENSAAIARTLVAHGINVNCAPMCDIRFPTSHNIIGDRAYGTDAAQVTTLALAVAQGLLDNGVLPVIKHIPGHGRATVDSHESLPVVHARMEELQEDFAPFRSLSHLPLAMTAHILYTTIDPDLPATLSPKVIHVIREEIGFTNLLMSDDLCMKALKGTQAELARQTLDAGCDLVLHCNGAYAEIEEITDALRTYAAFDRERIPAISKNGSLNDKD
jgi:beta-N-acetylhexosaminidase